MKKLTALLVGIGFFAVAAIPTNSVDNATMATYTGTLVDTKCYSMMPKANAGDEHVVMQKGKKMKMPKCATACANMGIPVALLDKNGKQHVLAAPAAQLADHMAKEAKVEGKIMSGVLVAQKIHVKNNDGEWEEVQIKTMM